MQYFSFLLTAEFVRYAIVGRCLEVEMSFNKKIIVISLTLDNQIIEQLKMIPNVKVIQKRSWFEVTIDMCFINSFNTFIPYKVPKIDFKGEKIYLSKDKTLFWLPTESPDVGHALVDKLERNLFEFANFANVEEGIILVTCVSKQDATQYVFYCKNYESKPILPECVQVINLNTNDFIRHLSRVVYTF